MLYTIENQCKGNFATLLLGVSLALLIAWKSKYIKYLVFQSKYGVYHLIPFIILIQDFFIYGNTRSHSIKPGTMMPQI